MDSGPPLPAVVGSTCAVEQGSCLHPGKTSHQFPKKVKLCLQNMSIFIDEEFFHFSTQSNRENTHYWNWWIHVTWQPALFLVFIAGQTSSPTMVHLDVSHEPHVVQTEWWNSATITSLSLITIKPFSDLDMADIHISLLRLLFHRCTGSHQLLFRLRDTVGSGTEIT